MLSMLGKLSNFTCLQLYITAADTPTQTSALSPPIWGMHVERSRSHQKNERPRYHWLEQHTFNDQNLIDKINGLDIKKIEFFYLKNLV